MINVITKAIALLTTITMLTGPQADNAAKQLGLAQQPDSGVSDEVKGDDVLTAPVDPVQLCKDITIGWNLGNTLDATGSSTDSETSWGNPKATKELILAVKDAGFDAVRIPTTWFNHLDDDFNVDEAWLDRVQDVVDYAYD